MKISVALCTYNGKEYIIKQLKSILKQTVKVDEIVICDDRSSDHTIEIITKYLHKQKVKFKIFQNEKQLGVTKNFEKCLLACDGDIILTSDQDDLWQIDKVEKIIQAFNKKEVLCVFTNALLIDGKEKSRNKKLFDTLEIYPKQENLFRDLMRVCVVTGATMAFRKELIHQCVPFSTKFVHDEWLALNAIMLGEVRMIDEPLIKYRIHDSNTIGVSDFSKEAKKEKFKRNLDKAKEIRNTKKERYLDVYNNLKDKKTNENFKEFEQCVQFFDEICNQKESLTGITQCFLQGKYHRYSSGIPAYLRDLMSLLRKGS